VEKGARAVKNLSPRSKEKTHAESFFTALALRATHSVQTRRKPQAYGVLRTLSWGNSLPQTPWSIFLKSASPAKTHRTKTKAHRLQKNGKPIIACLNKC